MCCTQGAIMEISISVAVLQLFFTLEVIQQHSIRIEAHRQKVSSFIPLSGGLQASTSMLQSQEAVFHLELRFPFSPGLFFHCASNDIVQLQKEIIKLNSTGLASTQKIFLCFIFLHWNLNLKTDAFDANTTRQVQTFGALLYNADYWGEIRQKSVQQQEDEHSHIQKLWMLDDIFCQIFVFFKAVVLRS